MWGDLSSEEDDAENVKDSEAKKNKEDDGITTDEDVKRTKMRATKALLSRHPMKE
jgi:hypothetical protein